VAFLLTKYAQVHNGLGSFSFSSMKLRNCIASLARKMALGLLEPTRLVCFAFG